MSNCARIELADFEWAYLACNYIDTSLRTGPYIRHKHLGDGRCYTEIRWEFESKTSTSLEIVQMPHSTDILYMRLYGWKKEVIVETFKVPTRDLRFGLIRAFKIFIEWERDVDPYKKKTTSDDDRVSDNDSCSCAATKDRTHTIIRFECDVPGACAVAYTNMMQARQYHLSDRCVPQKNVQVYLPEKFVTVKTSTLTCSHEKYESGKLKLVSNMESMREFNAATVIEVDFWKWSL